MVVYFNKIYHYSASDSEEESLLLPPMTEGTFETVGVREFVLG